MVEQVGLMRHGGQHQHTPGSSDQQPGPPHDGPARALRPLSHLLLIAQMQHRHQVPLSLGREVEGALDGIVVLQVHVMT